jgi:hypothetical protein
MVPLPQQRDPGREDQGVEVMVMLLGLGEGRCQGAEPEGTLPVRVWRMP